MYSAPTEVDFIILCYLVLSLLFTAESMSYIGFELEITVVKDELKIFHMYHSFTGLSGHCILLDREMESKVDPIDSFLS